MRSALYYPYTSIQSDNLIRTSLLLWDQVHIMVPWNGFHIGYPDRNYSRALELIGVPHIPSDEEKKEAHAFVEDFAKRSLPVAFSYKSRRKRNPDKWPVYAEKLLPETWNILRETGLAGRRIRSGGVPVTQPTGLSLLSILSDCCAGQTLARITDQGVAYGILTGLLSQPRAENDSRDAMEGLAAISLTIVDTNKIPLTKLIALREREKTSAKGHELTLLRHRYLDRLSDQAASLARMPRKADRSELKRQFEQDMNDDLSHLRSELGLLAKETLASKEVLLAVLGGTASLASALFNVPLRNVISGLGGTVYVGGLLASWTRFVKARRDVLKNHPMAYLYEIKGGLRI